MRKLQNFIFIFYVSMLLKGFKYHFIFLIWILPLYFTGMSVYQLMVYQGLNETFDSGESYMAEVVDFDVKQIAAQTNGYVILRFTTLRDTVIEEQLSIPVQMAQVFTDTERIPIRYKAGSFQEILILPTYTLQQYIILFNLGISVFGFLVTLAVSVWASRYANRKIRDGDEQWIFERIDE